MFDTILDPAFPLGTDPCHGPRPLGDALERLIERIGQETESDRMVDAALWTLAQALGADGCAIVVVPAPDGAAELLHECGPIAPGILDAAGEALRADAASACKAEVAGNKSVLTIPCPSRFGTQTGVAVWRGASGVSWSDHDLRLARCCTGIVRLILDREAMDQELAPRARTDRLTGLLNRSAFLEELSRHCGRLGQEAQPSTLVVMDVDGFRSVNDRFGYPAGDRLLARLAAILRELFRPGDLIARLGANAFAVFLGGADHMTAAERAHHLCHRVPAALAAELPQASVPKLAVSVGVATRRSGSREPVLRWLQRADAAMATVKEAGGGHWRVSLLDGDA